MCTERYHCVSTEQTIARQYQVQQRSSQVAQLVKVCITCCCINLICKHCCLHKECLTIISLTLFHCAHMFYWGNLFHLLMLNFDAILWCQISVYFIILDNSISTVFLIVSNIMLFCWGTLTNACFPKTNYSCKTWQIYIFHISEINWKLAEAEWFPFWTSMSEVKVQEV